MSPTLNVNPTLFVIPCKFVGGLWDIKYCNYYHLPSDFSSKFQSSMTIFVNMFIRKAIQKVTIVTLDIIFYVATFIFSNPNPSTNLLLNVANNGVLDHWSLNPLMTNKVKKCFSRCMEVWQPMSRALHILRGHQNVVNRWLVLIHMRTPPTHCYLDLMGLGTRPTWKLTLHDTQWTC